jgi:hypothetical protein
MNENSSKAHEEILNAISTIIHLRKEAGKGMGPANVDRLLHYLNTAAELLEDGDVELAGLRRSVNDGH